MVFAIIVYYLPLSRLRAEVDASLATLASEIQRWDVGRMPDGTLTIAIDSQLSSLETASTFFIITDLKGEKSIRSNNLFSFQGLLDPDGLTDADQLYHDVMHEDVSLRVITVPFYDYSSGQPEQIGYVQVARLFDAYENLSRVLVLALFVGFAGATASLFSSVLFTPSSFKPLEDIANVARQITNADDLSRRVPYTERSDEVGILARSFNQLLERLESLFQTQQRLLADVSHELRTPLTTIRGNVDLMRRMGEWMKNRCRSFRKRQSG